MSWTAADSALVAPGHSSASAAAYRIGVYGGAFDPPHLAHVALAKAAIAQADLDLLLVIPTGQAWHKSRTLSPAADRLAMVQLAFEDQAQVKIDGRETLRSGPTYTIDTLEALKQAHPKASFALFIGQDQAAAFTSWHRWRAVLEIATLFVAEREGTISGNGLLNTLNGLLVATKGASPDAGLADSCVQALMLPPMAISATDIRQRASKGLGISHLVPEAVAGYIAQHHLYRTA